MCQYSLEFAPTLTDHQVGMQRHPLSPVPEDRHKCDKSSEMLRVTEPLMPARYKGRHRDFGQLQLSLRIDAKTGSATLQSFWSDRVAEAAVFCTVPLRVFLMSEGPLIRCSYQT